MAIAYTSGAMYIAEAAEALEQNRHMVRKSHGKLMLITHFHVAPTSGMRAVLLLDNV
jgi:hypothetical protein